MFRSYVGTVYNSQQYQMVTSAWMSPQACQVLHTTDGACHQVTLSLLKMYMATALHVPVEIVATD